MSKLPYDQFFNISIKNESHENFKNYFESWLKNWKSKNYNEYIAFYDSSANYNTKVFDDWSSQKKIIFQNSSNIEINVDNLTIIDYPEEIEDTKYVEFTQTYKSNLLKDTTLKKQIWRKFNNEWKIISESTH